MTSPLRLLFASLTLALLACGDDGAPLDAGTVDSGPAVDAGIPDTLSFVRDLGGPVLNPRTIPSPHSDGNNTLGVFDPCSVWDPDAGVWRVYWSFADQEAEEAGEPATGMMGASAADGRAFVPYAELALEQQGTFDTSSVETCDIVRVPDPDNADQQLFYMFYSGSSVPANEDASSIYRIALAISRDGVRFEPIPTERSRGGVAGVLFGTEEALGAPEIEGNFITDPTVVLVDGTFHMWTFCAVTIPEPNGGVCYHTSPDGYTWTHRGISTGFTRGAPIQPTVWYDPIDEEFEMLVILDTPEEEAPIHDFPTNLELRIVGYFHATSQDGLNWEADEERRVFEQDLSLMWEDGGLATGGDVTYRDGSLWFYYPSLTTQGGGYLGGTLLNWPLNLARARVH